MYPTPIPFHMLVELLYCAKLVYQILRFQKLNRREFDRFPVLLEKRFSFHFESDSLFNIIGRKGVNTFS